MSDKFAKYEVKDEEKKSDRFQQYLTEEENENPENDLSQIGGIPGFLLKIAPSLVKGYKHPKEAMAERVQGLGRGYQDIGEGLKQLGLEGAEKIGLKPKGTADKYTKDVQAEREFYNKSSGGQDPLTQMLRSGAGFTLPGAGMSAGLLGKGGTSLLQRMLMGGAGGAAGGAAKFVPEDESRLENTVKGGAIGATIPAAAALPKGISKLEEKFIKPLFHKGSPQKTASFIQKGHDLLDKEASHLYSSVENEAIKRGINTIPLPNKLVKEAADYLPKTRASEKLIEAAKTGDYKALRKLQSDLRHRGELLKGSELGADRDRGEEILDLRNKINEEIGDAFEIFGHHDLKADLLKANDLYKKLKETYYSRPAIANMVKKGLRKVPKNINEVVTEISEPMEKIRKLHPELEEEIRLTNEKEKILKSLKKGAPVGYGATGAGITLSLQYLMRKLLGKD